MQSISMNHLLNYPLSCDDDEHDRLLLLRVKRKRNHTWIYTVYYLNLVLMSLFSLETCLFYTLTDPCSVFMYPGALQQTQMCQRPLRSKYYFIPSCLMRSQVCRASSGQEEKRTRHTPYKASSVRSCLDCGIIRIAGL